MRRDEWRIIQSSTTIYRQQLSTKIEANPEERLLSYTSPTCQSNYNLDLHGPLRQSYSTLYTHEKHPPHTQLLSLPKIYMYSESVSTLRARVRIQKNRQLVNILISNTLLRMQASTLTPAQPHNIPQTPKRKHITNPLPARKEHDYPIHARSPPAGRR